MITGPTYLATRSRLHLSRSKLSAMSKRAGHHLSETAIKRLENHGAVLTGSRGYPTLAMVWLDYVLGLSDPAGMVEWSTVERGAPVLVLGEKELYGFHGLGDDTVTVFGGVRNRQQFRDLPLDAVRLVAATALPPSDTAANFQSRCRGVDSAYGEKILAHMRAHAGPHSVGGMAYVLGLNNTSVSRVAAALAKKGHLTKVQRGVFVLREPAVEATSVKTALAERVMARR